MMLALALLACQSDNGLIGEPDPNDFGDNEAPIAVPGPFQEVHASDAVALDASASFDPDGEIATAVWEIVSAPVDAEYELVDGVLTAETLGVYHASLVVTDAEERPSENLAVTVIEVVPWRSLVATLDWGGEMDLDLHLLAPAGVSFGEGDCWFGVPDPDWGVAGLGSDDPVFEEDVEDGDGVERITLPAPVPGIYTLLVHLYNPRGVETSGPTPNLSVTLDGETFALEVGPRLGAGDVWIAGQLDTARGVWDADDQLTTHEALGGPEYNR